MPWWRRVSRRSARSGSGAADRVTVSSRARLDRAGLADYRGGMGYEVEKTDEQWREELSAEEYAVLRQGDPGRPFVGEYTDTETKGVYSCKACHAPLFESDTKFHSGCGWPSFYQPMTDTVEYLEDNTHGMKRGEVRCANCGPPPRPEGACSRPPPRGQAAPLSEPGGAPQRARRRVSRSHAARLNVRGGGRG